jgi:beta-aspartyl-peptidase (threonine type)
MNGYARSDSTTFLSDDTVTRGWQGARERYKIKYRSRAKMGKLRFSDLDIRSLSNDAAVVLGRWALKRANGIVQGHFTLVFRRTPDGWRIVHDHTSTAAGAQ